MKHKYGKWYADWRDEDGTRHAKALKTKKAAQAFTRRMQNQTTAKKGQLSGQSAKS